MAEIEAALAERASTTVDVSEDLLAAKQALADTQSEHAEIREVTEEVSRRLDVVIGRLKSALEE